MDIKRRNFLKAASGLGAGLAASEVFLFNLSLYNSKKACNW
ncbi:twin-arginine translocation signal domain-containing protein [Nostoc sp.]